MLTSAQAAELKAAGLDYYNHNLDTSAEYYARIITTRTYQDRLDTLAAVRAERLQGGSGRIPRARGAGPGLLALLPALAHTPPARQLLARHPLVRGPPRPAVH